MWGREVLALIQPSTSQYWGALGENGWVRESTATGVGGEVVEEKEEGEKGQSNLKG